MQFTSAGEHVNAAEIEMRGTVFYECRPAGTTVKRHPKIIDLCRAESTILVAGRGPPKMEMAKSVGTSARARWQGTQK